MMSMSPSSFAHGLTTSWQITTPGSKLAKMARNQTTPKLLHGSAVGLRRKSSEAGLQRLSQTQTYLNAALRAAVLVNSPTLLSASSAVVMYIKTFALSSASCFVR